MMEIKCECGGNFEILSQIYENGQINFKCIECDIYGFIFKEDIFVQNIENYYYSIYKGELKMNEIIQGSETWKELRKTKITSTDSSVIMGCNPWKTPYSLWRQKMDLDPPEEENEAMRRGSEMEPHARKWFINETGIQCEPKVVFKDFMMASLDGLSSDQNLVVEIKCGSKAFEQAMKGEIPDYYMCQIQHAMYCAGVSVCYYVVFNGKDGIIIDVHLQPYFIIDMLQKEKEFYQCLISFTPPTMTTKDYQTRSDSEWNNLADSYRNAHQALKDAEQLEKILRDQLIELTGGSSSMGAGIKLSKIPRKGNIDYTKIPELIGLDLEPYRKKGSEYWRISMGE
jgi:putative phage-type endonuclease